MKAKRKAKSPIPVLSAREMLSALGEHITRLRPSVTPKPDKEEISAARYTATVVNSSMTLVRTSLQVKRESDKVKFLTLDETP